MPSPFRLLSGPLAACGHKTGRPQGRLNDGHPPQGRHKPGRYPLGRLKPGRPPQGRLKPGRFQGRQGSDRRKAGRVLDRFRSWRSLRFALKAGRLSGSLKMAVLKAASEMAALEAPRAGRLGDGRSGKSWRIGDGRSRGPKSWPPRRWPL